MPFGRLLFAATTVVAFGMAANAAHAGTLTIDGANNRQDNFSGGGFTIAGFDDPILPPDAAVTNEDSNIDFITFCIERNEYVTLGNSYDYDIATAAVGGGISGQVNGADPLSADTAKLYYAFWTNQWGDVDFDYTSGDDLEDLQRAIWWLEGEFPDIDEADLGSEGNGKVDDFVDYAQDLLWDDLGNTVWAEDDIGDVRVLNLSSNGKDAQSQLVVVPLPAGALMGLAGLGLVAVCRRRRLRHGSWRA